MAQYLHAAPVSLQHLESLGWKLRQLAGCTDDRWLPVPHLIESVLPSLFGDRYSFSVGTREELGEQHGFALPDQCELVLREDVYEGMVDHKGRDRMTAMHEVAHLILHPKVRLARQMASTPPPAYRDPEWQAKALAGTAMMPRVMVEDCRSISEVAAEFGVSIEAARYRVVQQLKLGMRL